MISKEWLANYEAKETEIQTKFSNDISEGNLPSDYRFPSLDRFPKAHAPYSELFNKNIWSQLPFYGTSFIMSYPGQGKMFLENWGLSRVQDIDKLIDIAKSGFVKSASDSSPCQKSSGRPCFQFYVGWQRNDRF